MPYPLFNLISKYNLFPKTKQLLPIKQRCNKQLAALYNTYDTTNVMKHKDHCLYVDFRDAIHTIRNLHHFISADYFKLNELQHKFYNKNKKFVKIIDIGSELEKEITLGFTKKAPTKIKYIVAKFHKLFENIFNLYCDLAGMYLMSETAAKTLERRFRMDIELKQGDLDPFNVEFFIKTSEEFRKQHRRIKRELEQFVPMATAM
jgi:hypothetical protein